MKKRTITIYALGHFLVDFSCAYLLISSKPSPWLYVIYNFCAFALQMPIGLLADLTGYHQHLAVATAQKLHVLYLAVLDVEEDALGASALGLILVVHW